MLTGLISVAGASEAEPPVSIGVQSTVILPLAGSPAASGLPSPHGHGRLYLVLSVKQMKSEARLVRPVDETRLTNALIAALGTRGFQLAGDQQAPEILITVEYGRGWVGANSVVQIPSLVPNFPSQLTGSGTSPASESEVQKASYEKLFIRITAFAYSSDPAARAQRLWLTTIVADDPDHRDLNGIVTQMLGVGAPYFDRSTEQREVSMFVPAPTAQVRVGQPVVVPEPVAPSRTVPNRPPVAPPPAPLALKRFDLPRGDALATLQAFSRQSGEEIIYPPDQVQAVQTHAVSGEFNARAALERMLDQTGLVADWDEKSGICIIRRAGR